MEQDLNFSQKSFASNLRCTNIRSEIMANLEGKISELKEKAVNEVYENFGLEAEQIIQEALASYDNQTENHEKTVIADKRKELISDLSHHFKEAFEKQVFIIRKGVVSELSSQFDEIQVNLENLGNAMEKVKSIKRTATANLQISLQKIEVPSSDWNISLVKADLKQQIADTIQIYKEKQLLFIMKQKSTQIRREIKAELVKLFHNMDYDFWVLLSNFYRETVRNAGVFVKNVVSDMFELNSNLVRSQVETLNQEALNHLEDELKDISQDLQFFLLKKFKTLFDKTEKNVPINLDQINERYALAQKVCQDLLLNLKYVNLIKKGENPRRTKQKIPILSEQEFETIKAGMHNDFIAELERETNESFENIWSGKKKNGFEARPEEAKRRRRTGGFGAIPKWFWLILIFFIFDDVVQWLKNPLIFGIIMYPLFLILIVYFGFAAGFGEKMKAKFGDLVGSIKRRLLGTRWKGISI